MTPNAAPRDSVPVADGDEPHVLVRFGIAWLVCMGALAALAVYITAWWAIVRLPATPWVGVPCFAAWIAAHFAALMAFTDGEAEGW